MLNLSIRLNNKTLNFVYGLKREGVKYDLSTMIEFDRTFNFPHRNFQSVHITGSNAKGSVSNMIFNVLRLGGKTGLYTSPHLINFNERIYMQDHAINDSELERYLNVYNDYINRGILHNRNPTFFEVTTEIAFQYFSDSAAKFACIEVGLGGRLDATNIISPSISVITKINYEHTDRLGTTLQQIAFEKGGIIKEGVPVVTGETKGEPLAELKRISSRRKSKLIEAMEYTSVERFGISTTGTKTHIKTPTEAYRLKIPLVGKFQIDNARIAIATLENLDENIKRKQIEKGISMARWPGRVDVVKTDPTVIVDSSHNPAAATALAQTIIDTFKEKPILIVGMLSDKDHYSYLKNISKCSDDIILTTPDEFMRMASPESLEPMAKTMFRNVSVISDPLEAYEEAIKHSRPVLITGSMYLIGVICRHLNVNMTPHR
jgi:folylpolyglutamate synthase/dihydrofolate synthase